MPPRLLAALALLAGCSATSMVTSATTPTTRPTTRPTVTPTTRPTVAPVGTRQTAPDPLQCISRLPLTTRLGQLVWPAITGDELRSRRDELRRAGVGGVVLMTWTAASTVADLAALKQATEIPLLVATDEEGGTVQRMAAFGTLPSARRMVARNTPDEAARMISAHAAKLAEAGIDVVFAPVVDVAPAGGGGPIGSRSFSSDPAVVSAYATAYADAWRDAGILAVLKHFPGHGAASADSHTAAATTASLDQLRGRDLVPYMAMGDLGAGVMIGHLTVPGLTEPGRPASLSPAAVTLLRTELGYGEALTFTDALGMDAVADTIPLPRAAVLAIAAGVDVAVFTDTDQTQAVLAALVGAVAAGTLTEQRVDQSVGRVLRTKGIDPCALRR